MQISSPALPLPKTPIKRVDRPVSGRPGFGGGRPKPKRTIFSI